MYLVSLIVKHPMKTYPKYMQSSWSYIKASGNILGKLSNLKIFVNIIHVSLEMLWKYSLSTFHEFGLKALE